MAAPTRHDPYKNYPFRVEIDGLASSGFAEISGLSAEADVIEYREGADVTSMRKLPGLITYANVTLKCRLTTSRELFDWWMTVVNGNVVRRNVVIVLLDDDHKEVLRWILHQAWIAKIEVGDLNAKGHRRRDRVDRARTRGARARGASPIAVPERRYRDRQRSATGEGSFSFGAA